MPKPTEVRGLTKVMPTKKPPLRPGSRERRRFFCCSCGCATPSPNSSTVDQRRVLLPVPCCVLCLIKDSTSELVGGSARRKWGSARQLPMTLSTQSRRLSKTGLRNKNKKTTFIAPDHTCQYNMSPEFDPPPVGLSAYVFFQ